MGRSLILLLLALDGWIVLVLSASSIGSSSSLSSVVVSLQPWCLPPRGGASPDDMEDNTDATYLQFTKRPFWSIFRINADVKEEAATDDESTTTTSSFAVENPSEQTQFANTKHPQQSKNVHEAAAGRGGALTTTVATKSRRQQQQQEEQANEKEGGLPSKAQQQLSALRRDMTKKNLWWVDAWGDMADVNQTETAETNTNVVVDVNASSISSADISNDHEPIHNDTPDAEEEDQEDDDDDEEEEGEVVVAAEEEVEEEVAEEEILAAQTSVETSNNKLSKESEPEEQQANEDKPVISDMPPPQNQSEEPLRGTLDLDPPENTSSVEPKLEENAGTTEKVQNKNNQRSRRRQETQAKKAARQNSTDSMVAAKPNLTEVIQPSESSQSTDGTSLPAKSYISSGYWESIDLVVSLGLSTQSSAFKVSQYLRPVRKLAARATGMHGLLSGKQRSVVKDEEDEEVQLDDEDMSRIRRRIAAIDRARASVERSEAEAASSSSSSSSGARRGAATGRRRGLFRRRGRRTAAAAAEAGVPPSRQTAGDATVFPDSIEQESRYRRAESNAEMQQRKERVEEIDRLIVEGQARLLELACEKDALQRRPNPLYNYTETESTTEGGNTTYSREFSFPKEDLVGEYLSEMFEHGRLVKMNHTDLWKSNAGDDDEDESIGDDLLTPSADAQKLYEDIPPQRKKKKKKKKRKHGADNGQGGGGSWLLRQTLGQSSSLGERIGEMIETSAYSSICTSVMGSLARSLGSLHGVNIMTHSDVRVYMEQTPDLPPLGKDVIPGSTTRGNYAEDAIKGAMREGIRKRKKRGYSNRIGDTGEAFLQRDAIVETLISHCQISAPLLKLFPLQWQRALLGNIITLIAAIVSDFCDGIEFQILGHALTCSFKPLTQSDLIRHIGTAGRGFNHRRARPEQFEAAVRATAEDVSQSLHFLDRWHERALGSGMLRAQIANLIARVVLTLADEVLSGAKMDLWSSQAGGPRMLLGLEYRTSPTPDVKH